MNRRTYREGIAANVKAAMISAGTDTQSVAKATDMNTSVMESRLSGDTDFTCGELLQVGGFIHVPAHSLMEVTA